MHEISLAEDLYPVPSTASVLDKGTGTPSKLTLDCQQFKINVAFLVIRQLHHYGGGWWPGRGLPLGNITMAIDRTKIVFNP